MEHQKITQVARIRIIRTDWRAKNYVSVNRMMRETRAHSGSDVFWHTHRR